MGPAALLTFLSLAVPVADEAPASGCSGPPRVSYAVVASHGAIQEATDYSLAEISQMAHRTGRLGKHAPLGFYFAGFGYNVAVDVSALSETTCSEPVHVTVTMMLFDRHIQIAKELVTQPCLFSLVRDHYHRHAHADDVVLSASARSLQREVERIPLPSLQHDAALVDEDRQRFQHAIAASIDEMLAPLDVARANARERVDTPEEVKKLSGSCESGA